MKIKKKMPKKGQFAVLWEHNRETWSETLRWNHGKLWRFSATKDDWVNETYSLDFYQEPDKTYIKL